MTQQKSKFNEGLYTDDLVDRISDTVFFDQYSPKLGGDDDIIVSSFKVFGKQPAYDLENFIEKGYNWVVDAETSPGEIGDGEYVVFVEAERRTSFPKNFMSLLDDMKNITNVKDWKMVYFSTKLDERKREGVPLTLESLTSSIPLSPHAYRELKSTQNVIESMLNTARVPRKQGDVDGFRAFKRRSRG
jgi:hypothetical protein